MAQYIPKTIILRILSEINFVFPISIIKMDEYSNQEKTYYKVNCSKCGDETEVPFKPIEGKAVYCRICYRKMRQRY